MNEIEKQVDVLGIGKELDEAVAEEVLGWTRPRKYGEAPEWMSSKPVGRAEDRSAAEAAWRADYYWTTNEGGFCKVVPCFSKNLEWARVVQALILRGLSVDIKPAQHGQFRVRVSRKGEELAARTRRFLPYTVCMAALLAARLLAAESSERENEDGDGQCTGPEPAGVAPAEDARHAG